MNTGPVRPVRQPLSLHCHHRQLELSPLLSQLVPNQLVANEIRRYRISVRLGSRFYSISASGERQNADVADTHGRVASRVECERKT